MEDLALHILDIAQNSLEAGTSVLHIDLLEDPGEDRLLIEVRDNGCGMDSETLAKAADPFFTTRSTRRVGLGLPLIAAAARAAGGTFLVDSKPGQGSRVQAIFQYSHIDRAPIGDIETTLMVLLAGHPKTDIYFRHRVGDQEFELKSCDFRAAGIDLSSHEGLTILREAIRRGEAGLPMTPASPKVN